MIYEVSIAGKTHKVELSRAGEGWLCKLDGRELPLDVIAVQNGALSILVEGRSYEVRQENTPTETSIVVGRERFGAVVRDPRSLRSRRSSGASEAGIKKVV